jgi:hypothetical protein
MAFPTLAVARQHCKADSADDTVLQIYLDAAIAEAARHCNRNIYADKTTLDTEVAGVAAAMVTANAAYATALADADAITIAADKQVAIELAYNDLQKAQVANYAISQGIVATNDINAAILLIVGHLYRSREEVVTGQGAAAVQLPLGAGSILDRYRLVGLL